MVVVLHPTLRAEQAEDIARSDEPRLIAPVDRGAIVAEIVQESM